MLILKSLDLSFENRYQVSKDPRVKLKLTLLLRESRQLLFLLTFGTLCESVILFFVYCVVSYIVFYALTIVDFLHLF